MAAGAKKTWPRRPIIFEINTWVWLNELSQRYDQQIRLGDVPAEEWDRLAGQGFDGIWLMGVWERSPAGRAISLSTCGDRGKNAEKRYPIFRRRTLTTVRPTAFMTTWWIRTLAA